MTIAHRITATAFAITLAAPLLAAQIDPAIDTDGDGAYSLAELQVVAPDMTEDSFNSYDISADGVLDADEAAAMQEAGLLPAKEG
ncbi:hypothetical protein SAMN06265173_11465 [Thalassovita litoralis]|jgi:hypothetical protein|uniref:EF hand n=1 Tax=Thalassovita litoralis TaxID=1010611 RepID=A0A521E6D4_9RHOB|nr:hypothetical protein [Thalassovita litoralis]SMO78740.1 hypothetical protein SAMN06265173_11465 [Thalassovita litoralis]